MNDFITTMLGRRSVRKYTAEPVAQKDIDAMLAAAMSAPSARHAATERFIVITDRAALDAIPAFSPFAGMVKQAPLAILICSDTTKELSPGYWPQDCAAAMENLLLAAHALGLGAVWTGIYPKDDRVQGFRTAFKLPEGVMPLGLAVIGHPAEQPEPHTAEVNQAFVHYNQW